MKLRLKNVLRLNVTINQSIDFLVKRGHDTYRMKFSPPYPSQRLMYKAHDSN